MWDGTVWTKGEGENVCILEGGTLIRKGMPSFDAELLAVHEAVLARQEVEEVGHVVHLER